MHTRGSSKFLFTLILCAGTLVSPLRAEKENFQGLSLALYDEVSLTKATLVETKSGRPNEVSFAIGWLGFGAELGYLVQIEQFVFGGDAYYTYAPKQEVKNGNDISYFQTIKGSDWGVRAKFGYIIKGALPFIGIGYTQTPFQRNKCNIQGKSQQGTKQKFGSMTFQFGMDVLLTKQLVFGISGTYIPYGKKTLNDFSPTQTLTPKTWSTRFKLAWIF